MFPIFFSVSSNDITYAEQVWEALPDDWIYLYSKTGEESAHMWEEIARKELPESKIFVVFWSRSYIKASGCIREILQARDLVQRGLLRPVILRLDDLPIIWDHQMGDSAKLVFEALESMLPYRTSSPILGVQRAISIVQRVAEPVLKSNHPRLPRNDLMQTLRKVAIKDRFNCHPAVWISGFNSVGRETLVREFNRSFTPNGQGFVVEINEASLPKQTLLRIESEALGAGADRLRELNASHIENEIDAVAAAIGRAFSAGNYLIFRHRRIVEEKVELPEWLDDVVNALSPATRPKLFIISQLPLLADRRARCRECLVALRVPTVDEHQLLGFCLQLVGHFDRNPGRWADAEIARIVRASGGTVGFLVSLVRSAAGIEDFDQIDRLVAADSLNMAASTTTYVRWAFSQLRDLQDEQRVLLFLNDISPCDIIDIDWAVSPSRPILRVLGKLLELGLVERESDNLYRLTPLLANRLSRDLIRPELLTWMRDTLIEFIKQPFELDADGHEYLRVESRIQASILTGEEYLPKNVVEFVSAAHWLQAGMRLYHARRREPAYRILKKAYLQREEFSSASRTELSRYFCLSATRNRMYKEAEDCIYLLDCVTQTKSMAAFLRADMWEHQRKFIEAVNEYKRALELNKGKGSRLERTYRPLIKCILASRSPDFQEAEKYAREWLRFRRTVFSLMALARVYLHWKYHKNSAGRNIPDNIDVLYSDALVELETDPGVGSAHFELKAEEAELSGDYDSALDYMDKAIAADPRFELRSERWRLMAKSDSSSHVNQVLEELEVAKHNVEFQNNWIPFLPSLAETYAIALHSAEKGLGSLNTFAPELPGDEIGGIVARVRRSR